MPTDAARLELYARVVAAVAAGQPEEEAYPENGLDAASFADLEREVEDELSAAMDLPGDSPAPFLEQYDRAMRQAHARVASQSGVMELEDFARAIAALTSGQDPVKALEALGLLPREVAKAAARYGGELATRPELLAVLERARLGQKK